METILIVALVLIVFLLFRIMQEIGYIHDMVYKWKVDWSSEIERKRKERNNL